MNGEEINIMDVVSKNCIRITGRAGISFRATCPQCGGKSTLSITPSKNLFQCFLCNIGGNAWQLEKLCNPDTEYRDFVRMEHEELDSIPAMSLDFEESSLRAEDEQCSSVYKAMIKLLDISKEHEADLVRRGITKKQAMKWGIRTAPAWKERYAIPRKLQQAGYDLRGIPGFFKEGNSYMVKTPKGYLCPVIDGYKNQIAGFQPRLDKPIDGNKYTWFSSIGKSEGASSGALSSVLPGRYDKTAIIVEGTLKGLITYLLLRQAVTVITVPGVNSIKCLDNVLPQYEGYMLFEAYDMDKYLAFEMPKNPTEEQKKDIKKSKGIQQAMQKLEEKCSDFGISTHHLTWNFKDGIWNGEGKGIDDFLNSYPNKKMFSDYIIRENEKYLKMKSVMY